MKISSHLLNLARICEPERGYLSEAGLRHSKYGKMSCIYRISEFSSGRPFAKMEEKRGEVYAKLSCNFCGK